MANCWEIDRAIDKIAVQPIRDFSPAYVATETNLPLPVVFERLLQLVKDSKLNIKWEIRCPDYCGRKVVVLKEFPIKINLNLECICGYEFEVTPDMIFPIFEVNTDYKQFVKGGNLVKKNFNRDSRQYLLSRGFKHRRCIPR